MESLKFYPICPFSLQLILAPFLKFKFDFYVLCSVSVSTPLSLFYSQKHFSEPKAIHSNKISAFPFSFSFFYFSFRLWLDLLLKKMFQQKFDNKKEDLFLYKQYAITLHFLLFVLSFCNFIALEIRQDIRALSEAWCCVYKFVKK